MHEGFDIWAFLIGLPLGLLITGIVFYFNWRRGKKERRFDERYKRIQDQARSISLIVTAIAIVIAWLVIMIFEGIGLPFFLMTGIYVVMMISYGIGAAISSSRN